MMNGKGFERVELVYEGSTKRFFRLSDPTLFEMEFKDTVVARNATIRTVVAGKGELCNKISIILFRALMDQGVMTHFVDKGSTENSMVVRGLRMIEMEFVVRYYAAGYLSEVLGLPETEMLPLPVFESYLKDRNVLLNEDHIKVMQGMHISPRTYEIIRDESFRISQFIKNILWNTGLILADVKLEFGKTLKEGILVLGDELSPDVMRIWDEKTYAPLDRDIIRKGIVPEGAEAEDGKERFELVKKYLYEAYERVYNLLREQFPHLARDL
jgi:phosphoribosylaminoimidazole-succinocarboxamide synthase